MTNREYAIKKINEVLKEADDTELADIFIEVIKFPRVCSWCMSKTCASCNAYSSRGALPVYLITPDNKKIYEPCYEGYGVFGGHDVFALLAQWNFPDKCTGNEETDRNVWFDLTPDERDNVKFPLKFSENKNKNYDDLKPSPYDQYQGYFYEDEY